MSTETGALGELKAQMYFARKGFEIYTGVAGSTYYDFLAVTARGVKIPKVLKVEVKSTRCRNKSNTGWIFNIRKSHGDLHFDKNKVDYLCLYIVPLDRLFVVNSKEVKQRRECLILDKDLGDPVV